MMSLGLVLALLVAACAPAQPGAANVQLLTTQKGSLAHVLAQALADIVNKNHPSIRVTVTETLGSSDSTKRMLGMSRNEQKYTFVSSTPQDIWLMQNGRRPYDESYIGKEKDIKYIANFLQLADIVVTLDPDIKTAADLVGKRVNLGTAGTAMATDGEFLFYASLGLEGKVKPEYLSFTEGKNALVDGTVDAYWLGGALLRMKGAVRGKGNAPGDELVTTQKDKLTFIDVTRQDFERGHQAWPGYPQVWQILPANALGKALPPKDIGYGAIVNGWFAHKNTDEDVVYEIVKVLVENWKTFSEYHKATLQWTGPEFFSTTPFVPEKGFHDGALKAYKEYGFSIGGTELPFK
jgi:TRAP transporter TAXI family solute receptor